MPSLFSSILSVSLSMLPLQLVFAVEQDRYQTVFDAFTYTLTPQSVSQTFDVSSFRPLFIATPLPPTGEPRSLDQ